MPPEMIKQELLEYLLENMNDNESRLNEAMRNPNQRNWAIRIIKIWTSFKKGKQEDSWNVGQAGRITQTFFQSCRRDRFNIYFWFICIKSMVLQFYSFCSENFSFDVRVFILPWEFWLFCESFSFCRENFYFSVRIFFRHEKFYLAVKILVSPWEFLFCGEDFSFTVKIFFCCEGFSVAVRTFLLKIGKPYQKAYNIWHIYWYSI